MASVVSKHNLHEPSNSTLDWQHNHNQNIYMAEDVCEQYLYEATNSFFDR